MPFFRNPWDIISDELDPRGNRYIPGSPMPTGAEGRAGAGGTSNSVWSTILGGLEKTRNPYDRGSTYSGQQHMSDYADFVRRLTERGRSMGGPAGVGAIGSIAGLNAPPTIADIMARLEQLSDPSRFMMDEGALSQQAMAAASAQYDPLIAALRGQMQSTESRANRNKAALGQMFGELSGSLRGEIPGIRQRNVAEQKDLRGQYNQLAGQIKKQYDTSEKEQTALMERLGTQAAAGDVLPAQQRDEDFFTNLARTEGQTNVSALAQEGRNFADYTQAGAQIARHEGTSRQADLMAQLQDILGEYEGQIGSHQAAKQAAYVSGLGQLQRDMLDQAFNRADRETQNYLTMINLGRQLRRDEFEMSQAGAGAFPEVAKSPADVSARALGMGLGQESAQDIQDVFMSTIGRDPRILAGVDEESGLSLPREALAAQIVEAGRASGLSQSELNALLTIALEYFGRR
jgi:hypothetical protein